MGLKLRIRRANESGVTFIEVMIVLAIIALVFTISFSVFQRYFGQESFRQSVTLFTAHMNDVLNDVRTGKTPDRGGIICKKSMMDEIEFDIVPKADPKYNPGNSNDCHLIGRAVQLGIDGTVGGDGGYSNYAEEYAVHYIIALTATGDGEFDKSKISIFESTLPQTHSKHFSTSSDYPVPHGGLISKVYIHNDGNNNGEFESGEVEAYLDGFAVVISRFGERNTNNDVEFLGGSRNISLRAIYPDTLAKDKPDRNRALREPFSDSNSFAARTRGSQQYYHVVEHPIIICLDSGRGDVAFIRIGSKGGSLTAQDEQDPSVAADYCD